MMEARIAGKLQGQPETRTAKIRIELPNPDGAMIAHMYADVVRLSERPLSPQPLVAARAPTS